MQQLTTLYADTNNQGMAGLIILLVVILIMYLAVSIFCNIRKTALMKEAVRLIEEGHDRKIVEERINRKNYEED